MKDNIFVLFHDADTCKKYTTAEDFIDDCRKNKWGALDICEIIFVSRDYSCTCDFFSFLYAITWTRIKIDFVNSIGFRFSSEATEVTVKELLKRMTRADSDKIKVLREVLLDILEEEVIKYDANSETLGELERVREYLDCFSF